MSSQSQTTRVVNHKFLRTGTGIIAVGLPWLVWALDNRSKLESISASYYTDSGDLFVGGLIAVAFFLGAYNGTGTVKKDAEFWLSKCAAVFALLVALVPTTCDYQNCEAVPAWVNCITFGQTTAVHYGAAVSLFACLFLLIMHFSKRAKHKGKPKRSAWYKTIGWAMIIGMVVIGVVGLIIDWGASIFWLEVWGLMLFGAGWLVAGLYPSEAAHVSGS